MNVEANITISAKLLKKYEEEGRVNAEEYYEEGYINDYDPLVFQSEIRNPDVFFDGDELCIAGDLYYGTDDIASIYLSIPIDMEMMMMFVEYIFEKLQMIKKALVGRC